MVAYTAARIGRSANNVCAPITTVVSFSCMLMFVFILYQPNAGPGMVQRVGWQSWDVVGTAQVPPTVDTSTGVSSDTPVMHEGVDWWNVTSASPAVDSSSLPLDFWAPLMPHDTGLSEIAVTWCSVSPSQNWGMCDPETTAQDDSHKGKWVRVERNLNLEGGFLSGHLNIYYRRTRRLDVRLITEIKLLGADEQPSYTDEDDWQRVGTSLRSGIMRAPPLYIWYKLGKTGLELSADEKSQLVTELDVLYGKDVPWYGFEKLEPPTMDAPDREPTYLTARRGVKLAPKAPPLHFSADGRFRILQVADLHYSVSQGVCRDTREPCVGSDNLTTTLLMQALDAEKPDLVVFSGDQLNGQGTSWDPKSVLAKFARAVTDRKIPWAAVFGNHDSEIGADREEQIQMMKALPYSLVERGPSDIHGEGNYMLKVKSADSSMTHLLTLYFLDSGSYSKGYWNFWGAFTPTAYDWIRQSQIDWFLQESATISPVERPFSPDTTKGFGQDEQTTPMTRKLAKPNALMFFHMPLPESYKPADKNPETTWLLDVGLHGLEPAGNAKSSDGFFEKALLSAKESDHVSSALPEVKVVGNGHCHLTENCRRVQGVWLCFGGGGSYSGYGRVGFDRRFRVYDISDYGETIKTYKRTEADRVIDEMVLSGKGAAAMS